MWWSRATMEMAEASLAASWLSADLSQDVPSRSTSGRPPRGRGGQQLQQRQQHGMALRKRRREPCEGQRCLELPSGYDRLANGFSSGRSPAAATGCAASVVLTQSLPMVAFAALTATMTDTFVAALGVIAQMIAFQIVPGLDRRGQNRPR